MCSKLNQGTDPLKSNPLLFFQLDQFPQKKTGKKADAEWGNITFADSKGMLVSGGVVSMFSH